MTLGTSARSVRRSHVVRLMMMLCDVAAVFPGMSRAYVMSGVNYRTLRIEGTPSYQSDHSPIHVNMYGSCPVESAIDESSLKTGAFTQYRCI